MSDQDPICAREGCGKRRSEHTDSWLKPNELSHTFLEPYDNWHTIPEEYQWAAKDDNGLVYFHKYRPILNGHTWASVGAVRRFSQPTNCHIPWNESLQKRPQPRKEGPIAKLLKHAAEFTPELPPPAPTDALRRLLEKPIRDVRTAVGDPSYRHSVNNLIAVLESIITPKETDPTERK